MTSLAIIGLLFALLAIGMPVGFAMAVAGAAGLLVTAGTVATARPPFRRPIQTDRAWNRPSAMPLATTSSAIRMNMGMAISS